MTPGDIVYTPADECTRLRDGYIIHHTAMRWTVKCVDADMRTVGLIHCGTDAVERIERYENVYLDHFSAVAAAKRAAGTEYTIETIPMPPIQPLSIEEISNER